MSTIYKIIDPRDSSVRYIGVTRIPLKKRLSVHVRKARRGISTSKFYRWLATSLEEGMIPLIESVTCTTNEERANDELTIIQAFKLVGHPIMNTYKMY